jgi:hypothetical protein
MVAEEDRAANIQYGIKVIHINVGLPGHFHKSING